MSDCNQWRSKFTNCHLAFCLWLSVPLWVHCVEGLFGNVHRKRHSSICCGDAVHDGGQGTHVPLFWRVSSTQEICKETKRHSVSERGRTDLFVLSNETVCELTLTAVALCALLGSAAPLWATAAGAARTGLTWRRHLLPWRYTHRRYCQSCSVMTWHTPPHTEIQYTPQCSVNVHKH